MNKWPSTCSATPPQAPRDRPTIVGLPTFTVCDEALVQVVVSPRRVFEDQNVGRAVVRISTVL
jgi:hypothetical protein